MTFPIESTTTRTILHVDMDAFYASVEQRDHPEWRGRPVIVGGDWGRGVVTASSYEARAFGVHSAMPGRRATQLCPDAIFTRVRLDHYAAVGRQVREIFHRFTPIVQPLSLDEAFLDVTDSLRLHGDGACIARAIQQTIADELSLPASVGIAPLKFVAKIASDLNKPNGFVEVKPGGVQSFLDPLPVSRLWGVGRVGQAKLERLGFRVVADLRRCEPSLIATRLGSWGTHLWRLANGIDASAVVVDHEAKGIGHERTFDEDLADEEVMHGVISYLSEQVARRLRACGRLAKTVTLKYRREDFRTYSRARRLAQPTDRTTDMIEAASACLDEMRRRQPRRVRLLGVTLQNLTPADTPQQLSLFDEATTVADGRVDRVADAITAKLGTAGIYRGSSHLWLEQKKRKHDR